MNKRLGLFLLALLVLCGVWVFRQDWARDFAKQTPNSEDRLSIEPDANEEVVDGPAYPPEHVRVDQLREACAPLLAMTPDEVADLVPVQAGMYFTDCPACEGGAEDTGNFAWTPEAPDQIVCTDCSEVYPGNPDFPETGLLEVESLEGMHRFPYHERADGYRLYFAAKRDDLARDYLAKRCLDLAQLWWVTREDAYAERAEAILLRFAEVYPGYTVRYDHPGREKIIRPPGSDYIVADKPRTAKWSWWGYMDLARELVQAYDLLRWWPPMVAMDSGSAPTRIENDLLGAMLDRTMAYPETYTNMSPTKWNSALQAARVLRRPEVVHEVFTRFHEFLDGRFHHDGSWHETSPSYMMQVWGTMDVIAGVLDGYADPPGYRHPHSGARIGTREIEDLLGQRDTILDVVMATRLPDGRLLPVNDTWWTGKRPAREEMEAVLAPGFGVAVLGAGRGEHQLHAWLNFTSGWHHAQFSALSIGLWANGHEWLSDIGYTHTWQRFWASSTASHNTVTVDGQNQQRDNDYVGTRLRLWVDSGNGFQSAEAESTSVYPDLSRYRRSLLFIGGDARDGYLVDVFQVHGGNQHDFILAGNADADTTATADVPLEEYPGNLLPLGVEFVTPRSTADWAKVQQTPLGYIKSLRRAEADESLRWDVHLQADAALGMRSWVDAGPGAEFFLGEGPSVRRAGRAEDQLDDYRMPMLVARRMGESSTFVAVHEPMPQQPSMDAVQTIRREDMVVVEVRRANITDIVFIGLEDDPVEMDWESPSGTIRFHGRQGMVRFEGGAVTALHLVGGPLLQAGGREITAAPPVRGQLKRMECHGGDGTGGWFEISEAVPGDAHAQTLVTRLPDGTTQAYNIATIESTATGTRIHVVEDPAFEITDEGVKMRCFPGRTIPGSVVFCEILPSAHQVIPPPKETTQQTIP